MGPSTADPEPPFAWAVEAAVKEESINGQVSVQVRRIEELRLEEQQQLEQVEPQQERLRQEEITLAEAA